MFWPTVSELNSAPSWNRTPWRACSARRAASLELVEVLAQHLDAPALGALQAEDGAQQHRLAGPRAADDAEHLAAPDLEVDAVVDHLRAEAGAQALDVDRRLPGHADHTPM